MKLRIIIASVLQLAIFQGFAQNYNAHWVDDFGTLSNLGTHRITKEVSTDQWGDAGANLFASLPANQSGSIFFTAPSDGDLNKAIGFDEGRHTVGMLDEIDFCFYLEDGEIYVFENGVLEGYYGSYSAGDAFEIQSNGTTLFFIHEGLPVTEITLPAPMELFGCCAFYNSGAYFEGVETDFGGPFVYDMQVRNTEPGQYNGYIKLKDIDGFGPYTFRWKGFTSQLSEVHDTIYTDSVNYRIDTLLVNDPTDSLMGLMAGRYEVEIEDANNHVSTFPITVSHHIPFKTDDSIFVDTTDWSLQGVGSTSGWGDYNFTAGHYYHKYLNGGFSFKTTNSTRLIIGFRNENNAVANELSGLDYGMKIEDGTIDVRSAGTTSLGVTDCDQSDLLSMEIDAIAGLLHFKKNGVAFHSASLSAVSSQFLVDGGFYDSGSHISQLQFFGGGTYIYLNHEVTHSSCLVPNGIIEITPKIRQST
ncbi:hypothetical protein KFE98_19670 [bacterium SCSIO 12741]|nr:hypothetical protein KFE98_19670 [bacterium SCSIO 12741]